MLPLIYNFTGKLQKLQAAAGGFFAYPFLST
jgi:hypothetical protein